MREMYTLARDGKVRKSEQDKYGLWEECTHILEARRQEKVSKTNMGNGVNARTY
jgi:hypothetical protein